MAIPITIFNAMTSVSGGFKQLADTQQARITQVEATNTRLEKLVAELHQQLSDAQVEINRLRDLIESLRAVKAINDAAMLRSLGGEGG